MIIANDLKTSLGRLRLEMEDQGEKVHTENWQAMNIANNPSAQMVELLHTSLIADLKGSMGIDYYQDQVEPNLPWAEDHFKERVCGEPINPGKEWENWPWGNKAQESLDEYGQFNHNYMERYWPKYAGMTRGGIIIHEESHFGIRHEYGDLNNLIELLATDPTTRQAYMPIWFPEDTGTAHNGRKPCTLGYHFIMRNNKLDITYYIRSCDMYRHLKDDIYLTIRLGMYILQACKRLNPEAWKDVELGTYIMHITSLHMFINDYIQEYGHGPS